MAYTIKHFNNSTAAVVEDGSLNLKYDISLIGKNYSGYGIVQNENFMWLLENFAGGSEPPNATTGQLWYDTDVQKLKINYAGNSWRTIGITNVVSNGVAPPSNAMSIGDFWWDDTNEQLYCRGNNNADIYIGGSAENPGTQILPGTLTDASGNLHSVLLAYVDTELSFVVSKDTFELPTTGTDAIDNFISITKGITLASDTTTDLGFRFNGIATNSNKLGGVAASGYITAATPTFVNSATFSDTGFTIGSNSNLKISIGSSSTAIINNQYSNTIEFKTKSSTATVSAFKIVNTDIIPGDALSKVGTSTSPFVEMNATTFNGNLNGYPTSIYDETAASEDNDYTIAVPGTIAVRTTAEVIYGNPDNPLSQCAAGSLIATNFLGQGFLSKPADLAENYLADTIYEVGTVLMIGGEQEVTAAGSGYRAIGTVSLEPAYLMNVKLVGGTAVALKGRVPVKIIGAVKKGDKLIAADTGVATALTVQDASLVFAIALESNDNDDVKLVEALIL
jgi:hypothetical protein